MVTRTVTKGFSSIKKCKYRAWGRLCMELQGPRMTEQENRVGIEDRDLELSKGSGAAF